MGDNRHGFVACVAGIRPKYDTIYIIDSSLDDDRGCLRLDSEPILQNRGALGRLSEPLP